MQEGVTYSRRRESSCTQGKGITGTTFSPENNQLHAREKLAYMEHEELKCGMPEVNQLLKHNYGAECNRGYTDKNKHFFIQDR
jgi:hypothetical protein